MVKTGMIIFLCSVSLSTTAQKNYPPVQVKIENGTIEGFADSSGLQLFLGIPFAKPPIGNLRWKAPQPLENWTEVLSTKEFGPAAYQHNAFGDMIYRGKPFSEDCLYLNVWAPSKRDSHGLPVLVYFYGGGFIAGDGSEPRYDGASMASKGLVAVTVNYRLNIFGFFAHPDLSQESPYHGSGNYGLLDQNAALQWVRKNIRSFGGDPNKVTIAGESAGSTSVSAQMASPLSKNLIAGAIGESGAGIRPTLYPIPLVEAEKQGLDFAKRSGDKTLADLRALSTNELYDLYTRSGRFGFPLVIDGYFLTQSIADVFKNGDQAKVPLLLGWNSSEMNGTAFMNGMPYTDANFVKRVADNYPEDKDEILRLYPHGSEMEIERSATALASDRFIAYSTWKWFDLHRKTSGQPVYRYLYTKPRPLLVEHLHAMNKPTLARGAGHSWEIEYCLGNLDLCKLYAWTPDDYVVSSTMQTYFANFIMRGDPNGAKLPAWPRANPNDNAPPVMVIDVQSKVVKAKDDVRYVFLDKIYRNN